MNSLYNAPPEKYYEACITYHIIRYFKERYEKTVYPFSISQILEKQLGYDFGYTLSKAHIFLAQFKRPALQKEGKYAWRIERKQLDTLCRSPLRAFYVLPAFSNADLWYEGLEKTYFLPAHMVRAWMDAAGAKESALLHETAHIFSALSKRPYDPFGKQLQSALARDAVFTADTLAESLKAIEKEVAGCICGYRIGG